MEVLVTLNPDGSRTTHVASLIYDLWEDYNLYRKEAEAVDRHAEPLRYKRLVRASVQAFFGYFEGVLNVWLSKLDPGIDLEQVSFGKKIGIVRHEIQKRHGMPFLDVEKARAIRNTIVHVKPTKSDIETMETLLDNKFFADADKFVQWLQRAGRSLQMECHPDVPAILKQFTEM